MLDDDWLKTGGIKKAEKLSQFVGPTSTYEKQPFWKGTDINSKAMPVYFFSLYVHKEYECFLSGNKTGK